MVAVGLETMVVVNGGTLCGISIIFWVVLMLSVKPCAVLLVVVVGCEQGIMI